MKNAGKFVYFLMALMPGSSFHACHSICFLVGYFACHFIGHLVDHFACHFIGHFVGYFVFHSIYHLVDHINSHFGNYLIVQLSISGSRYTWWLICVLSVNQLHFRKSNFVPHSRQYSLWKSLVLKRRGPNAGGGHSKRQYCLLLNIR